MCTHGTYLLWGVMDDMVLSLTSVQRPTQDSPIYPALHKGQEGAIFSLQRFIYSLSPLFQQAVCLPFILPLSVCLHVSFTSQPLCSAEIIVNRSDMVKVAEKRDIHCHLTYAQLLLLLKSGRQGEIKRQGNPENK